LLAVAAGVVFYGLLAVFPAVTALVSLYGLFASPSAISDQLSLLAGILPQGAVDILREQIGRLTAGSGVPVRSGLPLHIVRGRERQGDQAYSPSRVPTCLSHLLDHLRQRARMPSS
jgi:hypothetical protein